MTPPLARHLDESWLVEFANVTRSELLRVIPEARSSCVLSTRLGLAVLDYFGVAAKPQPVTVRAYTPALATALLLGLDADGVGYTTGVDGEDEVFTEDGRVVWCGHLVIRLTSSPRLIDLSADQLHEPDNGIHVPWPIVTPVFDSAGWDRGEPVAVSGDTHGTVVIYRPMISQKWRDAVDWHGEPQALRELAAAAIRRLR